MARLVTIVPHTHWDREWYAPFETFRLRLVELLDDLLPRLADGASHSHFLLDGQVAVVDDYLEIRPGAEADLARLVASGRLAIGPWYVLMDEFLVSGETIVRDLQLGIRRAERLGGAMEVGYLPDMFGHVAQMPQILRRAGLDHAVVWRGVPSAVDRSAFWWEAPDGSVVRAEYLPEGYGNGAVTPGTGAELVDAVRAFERAHADALVGPVLWMNGTDHMAPQSWLARVVEEANAAQDDYRFVVGSLADHLAAAPVEGLPRWRGELRSGARANLLMGVTSNRVDVKQAAARAERSLERLAEPLSALFLPSGRWPAPFLARAWRQVVLDAAHDSSCACSVDEVVDAVLARYASAAHLGEGLAERAVAALGASLAEPGPVAINPSARPRAGLVELHRPGTEAPPGTQLLARDDGVEVVEGVTRADCVQLVQRALDELPHLQRAAVGVDADGVLQVRIEHDPADTWRRYAGPLKSEVEALAAERPDGPARVERVAPPRVRVLARVEVPGFGWASWHPAPLPADVAPVEATGWGAAGAPLPGEPAGLANGLVAVAVDPATGTFSLTELSGPRRRVEGLDRLVDSGDAGDTYNWCPPAGDVVVDTPDAVAVRLLEGGPLRGRVEVRRRFRWPAGLVGGRRVGEEVVEVRTVVEVQAGSTLVRVAAELDNRSRDHRLRAWFPFPERAVRSAAECAFAVVERGTVAEGGPTEAALATYPSRRFVAAGGLVVVHDGLLEYELVDLDDARDGEDPSAGALALALLRCTGLLSNGPMPTRPLPAGPVVPTPGAQLPGPRTFRYGVAFGPTDDGPVAPVALPLAEELTLPLLVVDAPGGGERPPCGTALDVEGAEVSAVLREEGSLTVRAYNPTPAPTELRVVGRRGRVVDLRGRDLGLFDGALPLGPWELTTVRLDP